MTKVEKIEQDIRRLNRDELLAFRRWFRKYDSDEWDRQIEEDVRAGKLDKLAKEALAAHRVGKSKEI
jgi:lysyl-tRNA synthetase class I